MWNAAMLAQLRTDNQQGLYITWLWAQEAHSKWKIHDPHCYLQLAQGVAAIGGHPVQGLPFCLQQRLQLHQHSHLVRKIFRLLVSIGKMYACDCLTVSVCLSVCLSFCPSVRLSVCLSVCLSDCMTVCLYDCLAMCLSVCLPMPVYFCLYVGLSVWLCVCVSLLSASHCMSV